MQKKFGLDTFIAIFPSVQPASFRNGLGGDQVKGFFLKSQKGPLIIFPQGVYNVSDKWIEENMVDVHRDISTEEWLKSINEDMEKLVRIETL